MAIASIIFDFDGVILQSAEVKTAAFAKLFADWPDHVGDIVALHERHAGISRYEKFDRIYRDILRIPLSDETRIQLGQSFSDLALTEVKTCPMVAGALEFLESRSAGLPCFIASGTPEAELHDILAHRRLAHLFREAHGSPKKKGAISRDIMARHRLQPEAILFVGDAMTDYDAAAELSVSFLGIVPAGTASPFPPGTVTAPDLTTLHGHLERLAAIKPEHRPT